MSYTIPKTTSWRFSLADLLWMTAFVAVLTFESVFMGLGNIAWWSTLFLATLTGIVFVASIRGSMRGRSLAFFVLIALFSGCFFGDGLALLHIWSILLTYSLFWIVLRILRTYASSAPATYPQALRLLTVIMLISFLIWSIIPFMKLREVQAIRAEFPAVSLESQLAFERVDTIPNDSDLKAIEPALARMEQRGYPHKSGDDAKTVTLTGTDHRDFFSAQFHKRAKRSNRLKSLHQWELQDFIQAEGFGIGRRIRNGRFGASRFRIEPTESIPFSSVVYDDRSDDVQYETRFEKVRVFVPGQIFNQARKENLQQYHLLGVFDFIDPIGWGWIESREKVAGFVPHAFHLNEPTTVHDSEELQLKSLQLVTIDRFDEPRAFVLDHLPRMDEISGETVPTRELSEFEKQAIDRLRTNEDIVIDDTGDPVRMVGSIRALEDCLQCHTARRGELLGAFTYEFLKK